MAIKPTTPELAASAASIVNSVTAPGKVYIVAAGSGAPELSTGNTLRIIEAADVIFYDRLFPNHTPARYVGKAKSRHSIPHVPDPGLLHGLDQCGHDLRQPRHGLAATTPIALIEKGSTPEQRVISGTLGELHQLVKWHQVESPALIVIGEVVNRAEQLQWFGTVIGSQSKQLPTE